MDTYNGLGEGSVFTVTEEHIKVFLNDYLKRSFEFICPIIEFIDPVQTNERSKSTNPQTNLELQNKEIIPNEILKQWDKECKDDLNKTH